MPAKRQIGIVTSNKMEKTIVVKVENRYSHPIYSKTLVKTKKYLADIKKYQFEADYYRKKLNINIGDQVVIHECRPLSKRKCWELIEILSKSSLIS